jgi:hypothetical protein
MLLVIADMTVVTVVTRSFFFSQRPWQLPGWARRGLGWSLFQRSLRLEQTERRPANGDRPVDIQSRPRRGGVAGRASVADTLIPLGLSGLAKRG